MFKPEHLHLKIWSSVVNMANNPLDKVEVNKSMVSGHTAHLTPPKLLEFSLDLAEWSSKHYILYITNGDVTVLSETTLWLVLSTDDISEIFADNTLATSESDAYIYLEQSVLMDIYLNPNDPQWPLQVTDYRNDRVRPGLTTFDLDLHLGILTLVFSESINANKLQPTELTFQDRQRGPHAQRNSDYPQYISSGCS